MDVKWVVPGVLAVASMPSEEDLSDVTSGFKGVVVLAERNELLYDLDKLVGAGLKVLYVPIPDFSAPNLIELHEAVEFIDSCEKPVLVHCFGGKGRSGTVAVAYLMATRGMGYEEALAKARSVDQGFVETEAQHRVLRLYDRLLRAVPRRLLSKAIEIGERYGFGRGIGHASKVLELSIELTAKLEEVGVPKLSKEVERALYVAAILHDIGTYFDLSDEHREYSYKMILEHGEELNNACSCNIAEKASIIARLHGRKDLVPEDLDKELKIAVGIIRIADGLDYTLDQAVAGIEISRDDSRVIAKVNCSNWCSADIERASKKKKLLEEILGLRIDVEPA